MFSGSYIYFYPVDQLRVIQEICEYYKKDKIVFPLISSKLKGHNNLNQKLNAFKNLNYEGSYLVKGCTASQNYKKYLELIKSNNITENSNMSLRTINSQGIECVIEL